MNNLAPEPACGVVPKFSCSDKFCRLFPHSSSYSKFMMYLLQDLKKKLVTAQALWFLNCLADVSCLGKAGRCIEFLERLSFHVMWQGLYRVSSPLQCWVKTSCWAWGDRYFPLVSRQLWICDIWYLLLFPFSSHF